MKKLIIGDIHINEKSIPEINDIFNEIMTIKADKVIQVGDFYDSYRPTPKELEFGTGLSKILKNKYKEITIISGTGRHDILNDCSVIRYLTFLGINAIRGDYISNNILYGHWMTNESRLQYGTGRCGIKDLKKYRYVFLGHQHSPEKLADTIYHVGSIRYCNFNEVTDKNKQVILLEDDKLIFIPLKSPIPMIDVKSLDELLDVEFDTKVRLIISSFNQFKKEINKISKFKNKFMEFKLKLDFGDTIIAKDEKIVNKEKKNLTQLITQYIEKIVDKDVKELLKKQMEE